jgi:type IV pilus assembly protein PilE
MIAPPSSEIRQCKATPSAPHGAAGAFRGGRSGGVSLIELMVVLLIVALLASVAVPSYRQYVLRSHRAEAKTALLNVAAAQERFYLQNNTYTTDLTSAATASPPGLGQSDYGAAAGVQTENGWYMLAVTAANGTAFSVTATAIGSQADDTKCTTFTLTSAGVKSATGTASAECWAK